MERGFRSRRPNGKSPVIALCLGVACLMISCSDSPTLTVAPEPPAIIPERHPVPLHQDEAAWGSDGSLIYRDLGVICVFPEGNYIADQALAGLWVLPPSNGTPTRIVAGGHSPDWSPAAQSIAFESGGQ